jgi:predicted DNA-binding transcriptional regulator AlpA
LKAELETGDIESIAQRVVELIKPYFSNNVKYDTEDRIFTVKQLSAYIGLSESWIYNNKHKIPHFNKKEGGFKRKGKPLFRRSEIDQWLNTFREKSVNNYVPAFKEQKQR